MNNKKVFAIDTKAFFANLDIMSFKDTNQAVCFIQKTIQTAKKDNNLDFLSSIFKTDRILKYDLLIIAVFFISTLSVKNEHKIFENRNNLIEKFRNKFCVEDTQNYKKLFPLISTQIQ